MIARTRRILALVTFGALAALSAGAQDPPTAEELIERERVRSAVEAAFELYFAPADSGEERLDNTVAAAHSLVPFGAAVVLYLDNELEQERRSTFEFCTFALGLLRNDASEASLRRAVERAEAVPGAAAVYRKAWTIWALGLQGHPDTVDLLDQGVHRAANHAIHTNMSVLESVSVLTAPASLPRLLAQLERYGKDEALRERRRWTLRALYRLASSESIPPLVALLDDPSGSIRAEAARALGMTRSPRAVDPLIATVVGDENLAARRAAGAALERIAPRKGVDVAKLMAGLETEEDSTVRGFIYEVIMTVDPRRGVKRLLPFWGGPDWADRHRLIGAVGRHGGSRAVDLLRQALGDDNNTVAGTAAGALAEIGGEPAAAALAAALTDANWRLAPFVAGGLARLGARQQAAAIAARITGITPEQPTEDRHILNGVRRLGDSLVRLAYVEALPDLREALSRHTDDQVGTSLRELVLRLEALERLGDDVEGWGAALASPDAAVRHLAQDRLSALGTETAASHLVARFDELEDDKERLRILDRLGDVDTEASTALIERVLMSAEFDPLERVRYRDTAAWSARRIGSARMLELLESSIVRREGREASVLIYAAVLGGPAVLPLLERYEKPRLRSLGAYRGLQHDRLKQLEVDLRAGNPLTGFDVPPGNLGLGY